MPWRRPRVRWQRARAFLVYALLPALTLGGAPVGACCCGFGRGTCGCSDGAGLDRSIDGRVADVPAAQSPNAVRPCCRLGQGHCPGCCSRCGSNRFQARHFSGRTTAVTPRVSGRAQTADCCGRSSAAGQRSRPGRCNCALRTDLDVPKQAGPLRDSIPQAVACAQPHVLWVDRLPGDEFGCRGGAANEPPSRADRVIALCRLLI
jgi:hypothetical protein